MTFGLWVLWILICLVCLAIGFIVGKLWKSRKINTTAQLAKDMVRNPSDASRLGKQIADLWK